MKTHLSKTLLAASMSVVLSPVGVLYAGESNGLMLEEVLVTARQREESLKDVPIAVSAISGTFIQDKQLHEVRDVAAYVPGLNINSDSAGRAFVSMRGIGTTLIDSVQPGVGIFLDGVYQPNTSYLNTPLVDVERIEVLRGPQGTLFGNNTLGGAINVISASPSESWKGRVSAAYASADDYKSTSISASGPIVDNVLGIRVGAAHHGQDNFQRNSLVGGARNPLNQDTLNMTLRYTPNESAVYTINANHDEVEGGSVPYGQLAGPRDYTRDLPTNVASIVKIDYDAVDVKGVWDLKSTDTTVTAVLGYNKSDARQNNGDGDFGPIDFFQASSNRTLKTSTGEVRFDTQWSEGFSTLIGVFKSRSTTDSQGVTTIVPLGLSVPSAVTSENDSEAIFATAFWALDNEIDVSVGIRYDRQELNASSATTAGVYKANETQPRITISKSWSNNSMTYGSIARGVRGGGQNNPGAPNLIYDGDSVWTYELGQKWSDDDGRASIDVALFYNDYSDFIGPNALAPSTSGVGYVAVNLNAGDATTYGVELESKFVLTDSLSAYANLTWLHARVDDSKSFSDVTGYAYPGNKIPFVPGWNLSAGIAYNLSLASGDDMTLDLGVVAKGERGGATLDAASLPILEQYALWNASLNWQHGALSARLFAQNLTDEDYLESYIDSSLLARAGVPPFLVANIGLYGQGRRTGITLTYDF